MSNFPIEIIELGTNCIIWYSTDENRASLKDFWNLHSGMSAYFKLYDVSDLLYLRIGTVKWLGSDQLWTIHTDTANSQTYLLKDSGFFGHSQKHYLKFHCLKTTAGMAHEMRNQNYTIPICIEFETITGV